LTPTSKLVVDSWAWLELFTGTKRGKDVEARLANSTESLTTVLTLAEVVSVALRRRRPTEDKIAVIRGLSKVVAPTPDDAIEAGIIHAKSRVVSPNFSLADAFVLQLARKTGAKVLTGDPDFKGMREAEIV
jgi:predicted nucleic acid-binding protein